MNTAVVRVPSANRDKVTVLELPWHCINKIKPLPFDHVPDMNESLPEVLLSANPLRDVRGVVARSEEDRCEDALCWVESSRGERAVAEAAMVGIWHGSWWQMTKGSC